MRNNMFKPTAILGFFMIAIFVALAILSLVTPFFDSLLPGNRRYYFAGVLLFYAVLRAFRLRKQMTNAKNIPL